MLAEAAPEFAPVALGEVKAFLGLELDEHDALLAGLIRTATTMCERFTGRALLLRDARETVPASAEWRRLTLAPVAAITAVEAMPAEGAPAPLPVDAYAIDIDANGDGWVRITDPGEARRARVNYNVGMGAEWNAVPEPLRQGIVRLVAYLFTQRDAPDDPGPPAAVAALWRPWRRMRLS